MMTGGTDVMDALDVAAFLGAHVETIRRLARRGEIPSFKVGKDWRFRRDALERWSDAQRSAGRPALVLIVDDEVEVCQMMSRMVGQLGLRTVPATNASAALQHVSWEVPDLVILDLLMPEMSGPEFLQRLRESHPDLPVVIVTAYPDSGLMFEAMQYGPFMLVPKPIDQRQLERAVRTTIGEGPPRQPGGRDVHRPFEAH
jgi:excisionase family DNA binding protein